MRLNIYLISHPIIKQLSLAIINTNLNNKHVYQDNAKLLGRLLIYETVRKWMTIHYISIKNIDSKKELYKFDRKESYRILANLVECADIVSDINTILPQMYLEHVNSNNHNQNSYKDINIIKKEKIIIIEKFLNNYSIIRLLDYLLIEKKVQISQIKIMCITCSNNICEYLGNKYQSLEIYTTKMYKY
ncbi:uracil phosphoribosyltransferase or UMP pyrophosphorylase (plastid) [Chondrus crispus]|uniref:Uracil phosphoribosyltransferase or UMP pyrophosphorylase n=1 Tax=Chondrus crispus TaxID=2769 RepID=M5DBL9_CHOCR|nr:uracil phosphoribosyltransferase or UMP pyrophosphorylase [Chondrus crispus]CCP38072.1 uracil phosphoribosyltransferase or UMP pyrophosphorylase [Chondrus crispus]|eukprot:YP_007627325.1 uracil phosphoribosyltransferase or UMP pyrophosphorylase (plastid) [Chondrus crispus]